MVLWGGNVSDTLNSSNQRNDRTIRYSLFFKVARSFLIYGLLFRETYDIHPAINYLIVIYWESLIVRRVAGLPFFEIRCVCQCVGLYFESSLCYAKIGVHPLKRSSLSVREIDRPELDRVRATDT